MAEMKKYLILLALVSGCSASDNGNLPTANSAKEPGAAIQTTAAPATPQAALTGLYEGGHADAPSQLCVVEKKSETRFGLVVWGANLSACGGAGTIERDGDRLRFRMSGDQACTVEGRIDNGTIRFSGPVPSGCSYYCGAHVGFQGVSLARKGGTIGDAMKAKDPAGDPLCAG